MSLDPLATPTGGNDPLATPSGGGGVAAGALLGGVRLKRSAASELAITLGADMHL